MRLFSRLMKATLPVLFVLTLLYGTADAANVTGTVSYAGAKTGRIYLTLYSQYGPQSTSISAPGNFFIQGVPAGNYTVMAFLDGQGTGSQHVTDPYGFSMPVTVSTSDASVGNITLTDPTPLTPVPSPTGLRVSVSNGAAIVEWDAGGMGMGENAELYNVYWSTLPDVINTWNTTGSGGSKLGIPADGNNDGVIFTGLPTATPLYFVATGKIGTTESAPSPYAQVTVNPPAGGFSVSGTINFPGTVPSDVNLYLAVVDEFSANPNRFHLKEYPAPLSFPLSFTMNNVPDGTYYVYAILDMNKNQVIDHGDLENLFEPSSIVTVAGASPPAATLNISDTEALATVRTEHGKNSGGEWYGLNFDIQGQRKRPVIATLSSGPNVTGPIDIGTNGSGSFWGMVNVGPTPQVNDTYIFDLTYDDGTTGTVSCAVSGVVNSFGNAVSPVGNVAYSPTPLLSWAAATPPPIGPYFYSLGLRSLDGDVNSIYWDSEPVPSSTNPLEKSYNFDGRSSQPTLADGTAYTWDIMVQDVLGNYSHNQASFYFSGGPLSITSSTLSPAMQNSFYSQTLSASGGVKPVSWSITGGALPAGLTLSPSGEITGTPTTADSYSFTVQATDSTPTTPQTATATVSINVSPGTGGGTPYITTTSLPNGTVGSPYTHNIYAFGGLSPYNFTISTGSLPPGITLSPSGQLSGSPSATGTYNFTARVEDANLAWSEAPLSITVGSSTGGISGIVTAGGSGTPLANVTVQVLSGSTPVSTTTTDTSGFYSFTALATGSYNIAFSASGYNNGYLSNVPVNPDSTTTGTGIILTPFITAGPGSISGSISYSGSQPAGRVHVTVRTNNGTLGTSIAAPGPFTIRGVPQGFPYTVNAFMDSLNLGIQVGASPTGSATTPTLTSTGVTGLAITLTDPSPILPTAPTTLGVSGGDSSAFIQWEPARVNGVETADSYDIYWGASASVSKTINSGSRLNFPAGVDSPAVLDGLTNGTSLYFLVIPKTGGIEGSPSAVIGPVPIGPTTGGNTVSGTVNYSGTTPTGPLYIAIVTPYSKGAAGVYYTRITSPGFSQPFSVSGVPDGTYEVYAIFDMNNDKLFGPGDVTTTDDRAPSVILTGSGANGLNISLTGLSSEAIVTTQHEKDSGGTNEWYNIEAVIQGQLKRPVAVTLTGVPASSQLTAPMDIGVDSWDSEFRFWGGANTRPAVGEAFTFSVTYDDGTSETKTAEVTGVSDQFPLNPQVGSPVSTFPTFSWGAPAGTIRGYSVWVNDNMNNLWDAWGLPVTTLSVIYGFEGSGAPLQVASNYYWAVSSFDQFGNRATVSGNFTPTEVGTPPKIVTTVVLGNLGQTYDGTPRAITAVTTPPGLPVNITYNGSIAAPVAVGSYTVVATINDANYEGSATGTLVIAPRTLTVTADSVTKVYGASDPAFTYSATGLVGTDTVSGSLSRTAGENVGSYAITQGTVSAGSNYTVTYVGANLAITPATVTVTATAKTKTYGAADPALTYTATGLIGADTVSGSLSRTAGENVGSYAITQGAVSAGSNYTVTYVGASLTIGTAPLTITAASKTKTYGAADPALTYTATGLVGTDTVSGSLARTAGENVGSYAITQGTVSAGSNYTVTYVGASLTIGTAPLTITAASKTKSYGAADPALTYTVAGLVGADTVAGSLSRTAGENVGSYAITQGTITAGSNYTVTYTGASLTITPATVTVTAAAKTKTYGAADPALTYTATGLVGADTVSGSLSRTAGENVGSYAITQGTITAGSNYTVTYTGASLTITPATVTVTAAAKTKTYGAANPALTYTATGLVGADTVSGSLSRTAGENVGSYAITQGTITAGSNYTVTYTGASLTITPATVTVTAAAKTKTYGAANPALTYTATGLVGADTVSGSLSRTAGENVGSYAITQGTVTAGSNYTVTYVGASLTIGPAPLTITAASKTKTYGAADPALTYTITGLIGADTVSGSLSRTAGENVGSYAITQGTVSAGGNYTVTFVGANLTVTKAAAAITLADLIQTYTGSPRAATATTTPAGLPVVFTYSGSAAAPVNAGTYPVVATINDGNYQGSVTGVLTINKAPQVISFNAPVITPTTTSVTLSAIGGGSGNPVTFSVVKGPGSISGNVLTLGGTTESIEIKVSQAGNSNYEATFVTHEFVRKDGDMNGDGMLDIKDAMEVLRFAVRNTLATKEQLARADVAPLVNGVPAPDDKIDLGDAIVLLRRIVGLISW